MKKLRIITAVVLFSSVALALAVMTASAAPPTVVVMSGLDNPRGLALDRDGTLYVAEAGKGAAGQPGSPRCAPTVRPAPEDVYCAGRMGAGLLARAGPQILTDAGGNSLVRVSDSGEISTIATFPSRPRPPARPLESVPTCVAVGPDGAYYVGELSGAPFATGAARVYRVVPGHTPEVFLEGFTTIIDLAFGPDDSLYVLQHSSAGPFFASPGSLVRVAPDGTRTTVLEGLQRPTSVVLGLVGKHDAEGDDDDDGDGHDDDDDDDDEEGREVIYVSNKGTSAGIGEVLRIER